MKKIFIIILLLFTKVATAQELQFMTSLKSHRLAVEHSAYVKNHTAYLYSEIGFSDAFSTYTQLFYEYNIVKHFSVHAEYRNMFFQNYGMQNTFLVGLASPFACDYGYFSIAPLYRYDSAHMWQFSAVYGFNYKFITFDGYFDLYGHSKVFAYSENKLKFHFEKLFVGVNIEYSLAYAKSIVTPYVLVGIKF